MTFLEAYQKLAQHFKSKDLDINSVSDAQWNAAVSELGLSGTFQKEDPTPKPTNNPTANQGNNQLDMTQLGEVISSSISQAIKPIQDKVNNLEAAREKAEKQAAEQAKSKAQTDKQELVDKLYKEKRISKEQKENEYKKLVEDENFQLDHLKIMTASLPVNDAFDEPEGGKEKDGKGEKETEIKTGKFDPNEDWTKQKDTLNDEALSEIQSQIN